MTSKNDALSNPRKRNPIIRLFTSIWFGILLLTLIFVYSSIVSAWPPLRWTLEMTEMQAFKHPLFVALSGLLMISLAVTVVVRPVWASVNVGAIIAHCGLLLLLGGAMLYFGSKIEGDVFLEAPTVRVRAQIGEQMGTIGRFQAAEGATLSRQLPHRAERLRIEVVDVESTDLETRRVEVAVRLGDAEPKRITLTTESGLPVPISEDLSLSLRTPPPRSAFYDDETPTLYFRQMSTGETVAADIHGLPIYHEHYLPGGAEIVDSDGQAVESKRDTPNLFGIPTGWFERWRMPIDVDAGGLPFDVRITGYVPYVVDMREAQSADGSVVQVPVVATRAERRMDIAARAMSAIRLEIRPHGGSGRLLTQWCPFSQYPDLDARPLRLTLPGSDTVYEVTYSRKRHELDAKIAADKLYVTHFPGRRGVESYHSRVLVKRDGEMAERIVETNETLAVGRWTLYQSGFANDQWSYSILGVGNRSGIMAMNIGWVLVTLGCLYAFYLKPLVLRRARRRAAAIRESRVAEAGE